MQLQKMIPCISSQTKYQSCFNFQKEILNDLKQVCSLLGDLADQCNSLIDQYGPLVFDLLLPELVSLNWICVQSYEKDTSVGIAKYRVIGMLRSQSSENHKTIKYMIRLVVWACNKTLKIANKLQPLKWWP